MEGPGAQSALVLDLTEKLRRAAVGGHTEVGKPSLLGRREPQGPRAPS